MNEPLTLELAVVERRPGRKRKLTPALFEKIMGRIKDGDRLKAACQPHGISQKTLLELINKDPECAKQYAKAKQLRLCIWHERWLDEMDDHSSRGSPWATAWLLERNFPDKYALRTVSRPDPADDQKPVGTEIPAERLAEYGKLMLEFAKEESRKLAQQSIGGQAALPDNGSEAAG